MSDEAFWELLAEVDRPRLRAGLAAEALRPLQAALKRLPRDMLEAFEDALARKLYDLDGEAFAGHAGELGRSDDAFLYARCFVVASGREYHEAVLADPTRMPGDLAHTCEELLNVHVAAWAEANETDESEWTRLPEPSWESCSNRALWPSKRA